MDSEAVSYIDCDEAFIPGQENEYCVSGANANGGAVMDCTPDSAVFTTDDPLTRKVRMDFVSRTATERDKSPSQVRTS